MSALSTTQILQTFTEEINAHQGTIDGAFDDGQRLFARSVLPQLKEVRPGDQLQGGVALRATDVGVWLHPYLFRLICQNGAVIAETFETRSVMNLIDEEPETVLQSIREGVQACCVPALFQNTVRKVQTASERQVNLGMLMLPLLKIFTGRGIAIPTTILNLIFAERHRTQYAVANVITAAARDTTDPQLRWDLEELGGSIIIGNVSTDPNNRGRARSFPATHVFQSSNPPLHSIERELVTN